MFSPLNVMREAMRAVPAVKYALGVAGVVSGIAIIAALGVDLRVAAFGTIVMVVLMVLLLLFARLTTMKFRHFVVPILVLLWSSIILTTASASLLFTSVFFQWPADLASWLAPPQSVLPENQLDSPNSIPFSEGESETLKLIDRDGTQMTTPLTFSNAPDNSLEFTDVAWNQEQGVLDIKVRNTTDDSLVVTKMIAIFKPGPPPAAMVLPVSGKHEFASAVIFDSEPFTVRKAYQVSYVIPPRGADRYLLTFKVDQKVVQEVQGRYHSSFELFLRLGFNGRENSINLSFDQLLKGEMPYPRRPN